MYTKEIIVNKAYEEAYNAGYQAALDKFNMPIDELDKLYWNDEEWQAAGEEYINIYHRIMKCLPPSKRYLLFDLELAEIKQNNRALAIIFEHMRITRKGGSYNDK